MLRTHIEYWTLHRLVRGLCLDDGARADKLVLVLAGRTKPAFTEIPSYQTRFKSGSLGLWEKKHLRDFLALHGIGSLTEEDFEVVYRKLEKGLNNAIRLANLLAGGT